MDLDFTASPAEDRPGLMIRDVHQFSDKVLIIPPPLVPVLELFDGASTKLDLHKALVEITGELQVSDRSVICRVRRRRGAPRRPALLCLRDATMAEFQRRDKRMPVACGRAYPDDPAELPGSVRRIPGDARIRWCGSESRRHRRAARVAVWALGRAIAMRILR
jgi:hypothetical protein